MRSYTFQKLHFPDKSYLYTAKIRIYLNIVTFSGKSLNLITKFRRVLQTELLNKSVHTICKAKLKILVKCNVFLLQLKSIPERFVLRALTEPITVIMDGTVVAQEHAGRYLNRTF